MRLVTCLPSSFFSSSPFFFPLSEAFGPLWVLYYIVRTLQDPKLLAALIESRKRHASYAGALLIKDEPGNDPSLGSGSDTEKNIYDLKGKEMLRRLHEVGTLAHVTKFF